MNAIRLPHGHRRIVFLIIKFKILALHVFEVRRSSRKTVPTYLRYQASVAMRSRCGVVRRPTAHVGTCSYCCPLPRAE